MDYLNFRKLLTVQPMYLKNTYEDAVIRSVPVDDKIKYFVKLKGKPEFEAKNGSGVVTEALLEQKIISKADYDNF